jgi:hypothetical protein
MIENPFAIIDRRLQRIENLLLENKSIQRNIPSNPGNITENLKKEVINNSKRKRNNK